MNLVVDESVDKNVVVALRAEGHSVTYIAESEPSIADKRVRLRKL
jgi:hypothetical protein